MLNLFPAAAACAVLASSLASAGTIYKCTVDGKPSYGDRPCNGGAATELAVAPTPAPDPDTAARLARQRIMAMHLTERDVANEQRAERDREREQRSRAARQLKCDRLRLRQQWAQEDLRHAGAKGSEAARTKAQRHAQTIALECAS